MNGMDAKAAGRTAANVGEEGRSISTPIIHPNPSICQDTLTRYRAYLALADEARAGIMPAEARRDWHAVRMYKRRCAMFGLLAAGCRRVLLTAGG